MTGEFKGRMPERSGGWRYLQAKDFLGRQRPAGKFPWNTVLFFAALALVLAFVVASFIFVPDWYAVHQWKMHHASYDRPIGMPGMRIARFRVNPAVHRLEAYVEPIPSAEPLPQAPGAWMTAAGLYNGVPVAINVSASGAMILGALVGGTPVRCTACVTIGGLNGLTPVALAVDSYGDVNATAGYFGSLCEPGDITTFCMKDEFVGGLGTIVNVGVGDLHWGVSTVSSASTYASIAGAFPNLGIFQWTTAAGQGDGTSMQLSSTGANVVAPLGNLGGNAPWDSEFIVKMGSLAATRMRVGYANALAGCQTSIITSINASCDGFWVRYDTSAPAAVNVGNNGITRSAGGVVTVTVAAHSMTLVGQTVTIASATGCTTSPNGTFPVASIPSTTTYTFAQAGAAETCGGNAPATSTPNAATTYFIESKSGAATPVAVAQDTAVTGVTTFVRIRIQSNVGGTIIYSLYGPSGTLLAGPTSIAADVPTTNMAPTVQFVSDTSGTKVIQADYWSFAATGLSR